MGRGPSREICQRDSSQRQLTLMSTINALGATERLATELGTEAPLMRVHYLKTVFVNASLGRGVQPEIFATVTQ